MKWLTAVGRLQGSKDDKKADMTSFERMRSEWSRATVSHRGQVGSQGDHKTATWLG